MTKRITCENCREKIEKGGNYFRFQKLVQGHQRTITSYRLCEKCFKKIFGGMIVLINDKENNR